MQVHTKLVLALASVALFSACNRNEGGPTVGQQVDSVLATVEKAAEQARIAASGAVAETADKAKDVGITASITAELARDQQLSATRIDVDTVGGRVTLRGTAPDTAARERATSLANAVSGVLAVDNQLSVTPGG